MTSPTCPKCNAPQKDDYGMVACPKCGTILFIDMEGIAHVGEDPAPAPTPELSPSAANEGGGFQQTSAEFSVFDAVDPAADLQPSQDFSFPAGDSEVPEVTIGPNDTPDLDDHAFPAGGFDSMPTSPASDSAADETLEATGGEQAYADHSSGDAQGASEDAGDFSMDALLGYQQEASGMDEAPPQVQEYGAPGDPLGLNEYANSEMSLAKDGPLLFTILISGIDSKEMRESLREAIEDARFGWDASSLMAGITKGVLRIENVNPVKATILINRIKRLPVKIRWEQHAITQMEGDN